MEIEKENTKNTTLSLANKDKNGKAILEEISVANKGGDMHGVATSQK